MTLNLTTDIRKEGIIIQDHPQDETGTMVTKMITKGVKETGLIGVKKIGLKEVKKIGLKEVKKIGLKEVIETGLIGVKEIGRKGVKEIGLIGMTNLKRVRETNLKEVRKTNLKRVKKSERKLTVAIRREKILIETTRESMRGTTEAEKTGSKRTDQEGMIDSQKRMIIGLIGTTKETRTIGIVVAAKSMTEGTSTTIERKKSIKKGPIVMVTESPVTKLDKKIVKNTSLIINEETLVTVTMISLTIILKERGKKSQAGKKQRQGNLSRRVEETLRGSQALPRS